MSHEIWETCPHCGKEYDAHLHWFVCPHCGFDSEKRRVILSPKPNFGIVCLQREL